MIADALKLSVYFGESYAVESDALIRRFTESGIAAAALLRGIEGFGINRRIHAERIQDISTDLPLLAMAVDTSERIRSLLDEVSQVVPRGLVTLERARLATGTDVARVECPPGTGRATKLTIYCRADASYRQAVALLRRHGASGAIVLPGVDGVLEGRRGRARLFASNRDTPMVIISVGPAEVLERSLPHLHEVLARPIVTVERIAQLKHDGEQLEPLASVDRADVWQTVRVYTRRTAQVNGRALYSELTQRLREAGGAGATTILGDWGFSSDEPPHGDVFGRVASHRPTYTVYIDRPQKVAELWPLIDELTAEHGIVTSLVVPGYRERAGGTFNGTLEFA
jgi:PII-like signaling protein